MTIQQKAFKYIKLLKKCGVSHKQFAIDIGIPVDSIYTYLEKLNSLSDDTAEYLIFRIQKTYPLQWEYIKKLEEKENGLSKDKERIETV